jgi:hypothetical protein
VLHKFFLVECFKMAWEGLCDNRINNRLRCTWAGVQLESLIGFLVSSFKLEFLRLIMRDSIMINDCCDYLSYDAVAPAPGCPRLSTKC